MLTTRQKSTPILTIRKALDKMFLTNKVGEISRAYSAIPHNNAPEENGTLLTASYGDGVELTRIEGAETVAYSLILQKKRLIVL